jgi:hypothetical protein
MCPHCARHPPSAVCVLCMLGDVGLAGPTNFEEVSCLHLCPATFYQLKR